MAIFNVITWDMTSDSEVIWKYPSSQIPIGSQLTVREGQTALFVKSGEVYDEFGPGTHTLISANIPLLDNLMNLPFGGETPFTAEIWFVSTIKKLDMQWGTKAPIPQMDKKLGVPVKVRSFGRWGYSISSPKRLLKQIVGSQDSVESERLNDYFRGHIIESLSAVISETLSGGEVSFFEIAPNLVALSGLTRDRARGFLEQMGVELVSFNIESINIPDDEFKNIQSIYSKAFEANQLSQVNVNTNYSQIKAFEVMSEAAKNQASGGAGTFLGAAFGIGAGAPLGQVAGELASAGASGNSDRDISSRLREVKSLFEQGLISEHQFDEIKAKILEDI